MVEQQKKEGEQQQNTQLPQIRQQNIQAQQQANQYYQQQPMQGQNIGTAFNPEQVQQAPTSQQYQQQYQQIPEPGQETQPQQPEYPQPKSAIKPEEPKKIVNKGVIKIGVGVLGLLVLIIAIYFMFFGKEVSATSNLIIGDFQFCNNIDEQYNCEENINSVFKAGEDVYFVLKVYGMTQEKVDGGYKLDLVESLTTLNPDFIQLTDFTGKLQIFSKIVEEKKDFVVMKTKIKTYEYFETGIYTMNIVVNDELSGEAASIIKELNIE